MSKSSPWSQDRKTHPKVKQHTDTFVNVRMSVLIMSILGGFVPNFGCLKKNLKALSLGGFQQFDGAASIVLI